MINSVKKRVKRLVYINNVRVYTRIDKIQVKNVSSYSQLINTILILALTTLFSQPLILLVLLRSKIYECL